MGPGVLCGEQWQTLVLVSCRSKLSRFCRGVLLILSATTKAYLFFRWATSIYGKP
jgi:hypothetical protein